MGMIESALAVWISWSRQAGDFALGWLLQFPHDLTLCVLAGLSAGLLILLRRGVLDQQMLAALKQDDRQLAVRIRAARRQGDREGLSRYRATRRRVATRRLWAELRLSAFSFLPLAMLVSWAAERLAAWPLSAGQRFEFVVCTPASAADEIIHLVPTEAIAAPAGWLRELRVRELEGRSRGWASWQLRCVASTGDSPLIARFRSKTLRHPLGIGTHRTGPAVISHGEDFESRVKRQRYRPLGWVPGLFGLPPWLVGYLVLAVAFFYCGSYLTRTA